MQRCRQCETPLAQTDVNCINCGTPIKTTVSGKVIFRRRFQKVVTGMFFLCGGLTVASLFTDYAPSFITCIAVTIVMLMVKKSADEMAQASEE